MPKKSQHQSLSIKIGRFFEASANGRFAIVTLLIIVFGYLIGNIFGVL